MDNPVIIFLGLMCLSLGVPSQSDHAPLVNPIDLGFGLDSNSIADPGFMPFHYTKRTTGHWGGENGPWYASNEFASSEHSGTTLTVPAVTIKGATTVGNFPLNSLITKGIFLDVSEDVSNNSNYTLPVSKLEEWVHMNGEIPPKSVLIIKFGWSSRYPISNLYYGPSKDDLRWPGITKEVAQWIIDNGQIIGVGTDTASLSPGNIAYKNPKNDLILITNNIYQIDTLNLDVNLPPTFNIMVMPMKLTESPAAATRVIAY